MEADCLKIFSRAKEDYAIACPSIRLNRLSQSPV